MLDHHVLCCPLLLPQVAISMACRLRFCRRLEGAEEGNFSPASPGLAASIDQLDLDSLLK